METKLEIPSNYESAIEAGWKRGKVAAQRGYVSRVTDTAKAGVRIGGKKGHSTYFVLLPRTDTTRYCYRQYLLPPQ